MRQNMGLFTNRDNSNGDYDYDRLRRNLVDEFGAQSAVFQETLEFLKCSMMKTPKMSSFLRLVAEKALMNRKIMGIAIVYGK